VSFIDADVKGYRKEIAQWIDEKEGGDVKVYDLTMKATKDIHVPNEQTKVQTFIDLLANQKLDVMDMVITKHDYTYNDELVGKPAKLRDAMMKKGLDKETATYYSIFSMCLYTNPDYKKSYFTALKDKGFDAIEDSEDSFSHRINPLIVFERENTLKITKATELPEPSFDSKEWDKIIQDAKSAQKETNEYHKMVGIK
jgi:hypothetical protein